MMHPVLRKFQNRLRLRNLVSVLEWGFPPLGAGVFIVSRFSQGSGVIAALLVAIAVLVVLGVRAIVSIDANRVVREINSRFPAFEDSAELLLEPSNLQLPLQGLQRERLIARLDGIALPGLRAAPPSMRAVLFVFGLVALMFLSTLVPRVADEPKAKTDTAARVDAAPAQTTIQSARLDIEAPDYTGLPARTENVLEAKAPEGSTLRWHVQFEPEPQSASLRFHDGSEVPLTRSESGWRAEAKLTESTLYRIVITSAPALAEDRLYRLDAIVDQPPEILVSAPDKTLTLLDDGQGKWPLDFEVSDDYGIGDARLLITRAQGSGEQVTVTERSERLGAEAGGDSRHHRYRRRLDLASFGFAAGDDLIVRLIVSDERKPKPNVARSASYILRAPAEAASDGEGIDGIVQKVLPAYFRSQRQIIIDTEALIDEQPKLAADQVLKRSDTIGVDQKILRLRYGQFLGEEFESGGGGKSSKGSDEEAQPTQQDALTEDHGHQETISPDPSFGKADDILAEYGHTHDHAEAATLLDPETKKILRAALSEMWQAELHLRLGEPRKALPYENRALGYIKQVQQSTRIYLARVGLELPPVDESRRLSGERKNLRDPRGVLEASANDLKEIEYIYQSIESHSSPDMEAFENWLRARSKTLPEALSLIAAVDEVRRQPGCEACRARLLDQLWAALPNPAAATRLRDAPGDSGRQYLDRIGQESPR
jgi:hypothetical protein